MFEHSVRFMASERLNRQARARRKLADDGDGEGASRRVGGAQ